MWMKYSNIELDYSYLFKIQIKISNKKQVKIRKDSIYFQPPDIIGHLLTLFYLI